MTTAESDLLHDYVVAGSQTAFSALVTRHVDLVYSAVLRQVRSPQLAEDVTQNVFIALAKNAHRLKPGTPLVAWLYLVARRAATDALRSEARRRAREQTAVEMTSMNSGSPDWSRIEPMLDDAMAALDDKSRSAILLRFFEDRSLQEVGAALGTSEDAAQKRVSRALEQLRALLSRRGLRVGAASLAVSLSAHAVQAAPIGMAMSITAASAVTGAIVVPATIGGTTQFLVMTTLQKTIITATLALTVGVGVYEYQVISQQGRQLAEAQREIGILHAQTEQLRRERDAVAARWAAMEAEIDAAAATIAREHTRPATLAANDAELKAVLNRVAELKRRIAELPGARARAAGLLKPNDWVKIALDNRLETEADIKKGLEEIQDQVKATWANQVQTALRDFAAANGGALPADCTQLAPFLPAGTDPAILRQFQMLRTGNLNDLPHDAWLVADIGPVEDENESIVLFNRGDMLMGSNNGTRRAALRAYVEFVRTHDGRFPTESGQLQPYLRQPITPKQLHDFWRQHAHQLR